MLFNATLKVLAAASVLLVLPLVRAAPLNNDLRPRDGFSVTVDLGSTIADPTLLFTLDQTAPLRTGKLWHKTPIIKFFPAATRGQYVLKARPAENQYENVCYEWSDDGRNHLASSCSGEHPLTVLCNDKPGTKAESKVCAFFFGQPSEGKCLERYTWDDPHTGRQYGDGGVTDCYPANMKASRLWEIRPARPPRADPNPGPKTARRM